MAERLDLIDYHMHTARCGHARGEMAAYVERAIRAGLPEMWFSDHIFLYWLQPEPGDPRARRYPKEDVLRLRHEYPEITIRLAVEADFIVDRESTLKGILDRYPWDYVLGSVHFLGDWAMDDGRFLERYDEWDIDALYEHYFELMLRAAESGHFDTMAHLDLVKKFGHRPRKELADLYGRVARRLAAAGVAVEVNTSGLYKPVAELYPHPDLLTACRKAGVPATLGSDAHAPEEVARDFPLAIEHLRAAGYERVVAYEGRRRTWKSI